MYFSAYLFFIPLHQALLQDAGKNKLEKKIIFVCEITPLLAARWLEAFGCCVTSSLT